MAGPGRGLGPRGFLTDEEKKNMPKVSGALLGRILGYLKPYALQFLLVFVTILLSAVVGLLPSIITGRIVDEALVGDDLQYLVQLLLIALAAMLGSQLIGVLENYINAWISQRIIFDMRNQMYKHLQYMPHSFFSSTLVWMYENRLGAYCASSIIRCSPKLFKKPRGSSTAILR